MMLAERRDMDSNTLLQLSVLKRKVVVNCAAGLEPSQRALLPRCCQLAGQSLETAIEHQRACRI